MIRKTAVLLPCMLALLLVAGCGGQKPVPVSGKVTLNEQPLEGAIVTFIPENGASNAELPGATGRTGADGTFEMKVADKENASGAHIGSYVVRIRIPEEDIPEDAPAAAKAVKLPKNAADGSMKFEVPAGGSSEANFAL